MRTAAVQARRPAPTSVRAASTPSRRRRSARACRRRAGGGRLRRRFAHETEPNPTRPPPCRRQVRRGAEITASPPRPPRRRRARARAPRPAAEGQRRDAREAHRRPLQRSGVDLRAQARRDPLRRGRATAATYGCGRATTSRSTAAIRRSPRRSPPSAATRFAIDGEVVAFERGRRASRGSPSAGSAPSPSTSTSSTCSGSTAATCARCRCARASGCCARAFGFADHVRLTPHRNARRRGVLRRGLPAGLGGADRQARRQHLLRRGARTTG